MMNMRLLGFSLLLAAAMSAAATAQVIEIGQFTGDYQETMETQPPNLWLPSYDVFDGTAVAELYDGGLGLRATQSWAFHALQLPHSGDLFMGAALGIGQWVFDTPARRFGGFFGTNYQFPEFTVQLFDEQGGLLAEFDYVAPFGAWGWFGWETTGEGIKTVRIIGAHSSGGYVMMDDMEYTAIDDEPWFDLGNALAGVQGPPTFTGSGPLTAGSEATLTLADGVPGGSTFLVLGASALNAPFKSGVLVPSPDVLLAGLPLDGAGALSLGLTWPAGLPSGLSLYWQHWIPDPGGPAGFAASNALESVTP